MSSRTGDVVTGESLLYALEGMVRDRIRERGFEREQAETVSEQVAVAAIKYLILKQQLGKNIVFDAQKAISFEGDSGPYLLYAHTRARSVLEKAKSMGIDADPSASSDAPAELERLLYRFPEIVARASREYEPHYVTTYLVALASAFNSWYANERIADAGERAPYRLALTAAFAATIKNGLWLLGIPVPEKM
jgi:arginyl-tRNA synthetase